jgi:hypothetical protein
LPAGCRCGDPVKPWLWLRPPKAAGAGGGPNHKLRRAVTALAIGNIGKQREAATGSQETVAEVPLTGLSFTREGNAPQPDPRRGHDHRRFRITRQRAIATAAIAVEASGNPGTMPRFVF